mmetsp:Transcript_7620/g.15106  ORF Transcript_7620/g.15106 Transcript_7620/m.15106 type:complete len:280 (+) Transcript_7620:514-1353(+)
MGPIPHGLLILVRTPQHLWRKTSCIARHSSGRSKTKLSREDISRNPWCLCRKTPSQAFWRIAHLWWGHFSSSLARWSLKLSQKMSRRGRSLSQGGPSGCPSQEAHLLQWCRDSLKISGTSTVTDDDAEQEVMIMTTTVVVLIRMEIAARILPTEVKLGLHSRSPRKLVWAGARRMTHHFCENFTHISNNSSSSSNNNNNRYHRRLLMEKRYHRAHQRLCLFRALVQDLQERLVWLGKVLHLLRENMLKMATVKLRRTLKLQMDISMSLLRFSPLREPIA